jgi:hypothetical protein
MSDARPPDARAARPPLRALPGPEVDTADWPAQAADTIERAVQGVRDKTTGPAINVAKWFVASLFLLVMGITVAVLGAILVVRLLDVYLPDEWFGESHVWAAYLILGVPVFGLGIWLLSKRHPPGPGAS